MGSKFKIHYFTFGIGQALAGNCQPILAKSPEAARQKMMEVHGKEWAFQYTQEEREQYRKEGYMREKLLEIILTTGE